MAQMAYILATVIDKVEPWGYNTTPFGLLLSD